MSEAKREGRAVSVLMTVRELASGGIERDVAKLSKALPRQEFQPYVGTYKPHGARYDELIEARVPVYHIKLTSFKSAAAVVEAMRLSRFIKDNQIQIVNAWDSSAVFAVPVARLARVPVVLSSTLGSRELLDSRSRGQVRLTDRLVDAGIVNCEAMRLHLVNDYAVPAEKIELCYNGVDLTEFHPAEGNRLADLPGANFVIGTVCVLRIEKALELLLQAFAKVRDNIAGAKLLIVGSGPELPKLQKLAASLEITADTIFVPAVPKVADFMRSMDLFVSTSYSEAFSNSILEAMACGCCLVASRVGGTPELVADGERGLLFESGNVDDLASKLGSLMHNPERRKELARNAAHFAKTKLSLAVAVQRLSDIYNKMLDLKNVRRAA